MDQLDLLHPRDIPSSAAVDTWLSQLSPDFFRSYEGDGKQPVFAAHPMYAARVLAKGMDGEFELAASTESQPEDLAHDKYFCIRRIKNNAAAAFAQTICSARYLFLCETYDKQFSVAEETLCSIDTAFVDLLSELFGKVPVGIAAVTKWAGPRVRRNASQRWIVGHQIFAAFTQGLIYSFREMGKALRAGEKDSVTRWAKLTTSLLRGSEACFLFTGDFDPAEYTTIIRPSMMPPASEVGLSGLMSIDHRHLIQLIRDMRPALKAMFDDDRSRHDSIAQQLAGVYDSHILVCERFVGKEPSILTASRSEKSGPSLISQFKSLRLKPFEHQSRAARLPDRALTESNNSCPHSQS